MAYLHTPYFLVKDHEGKTRIHHNCNGGINFMASEEVDEKTKRLILMAIEEGKRMKEREFKQVLGIKESQ